MKLLKLLGITMVVAVGLLTVTSSASATRLCLKVEDPCSKANIKSKLAIESTDTTFTSSTLTVECARHSEENEILDGLIWNTKDLILLHFSKCGVACTTVTGAPKLELGSTGSGNGVFKGVVTITLSECALGQECEFAGESEKVITLFGSETNLKMSEAVEMVLTKGTAAFCGEGGLLKATFTGTSEVDKMTSVSKKP